MHYRKKPGAQKLRKRVRKTLECNDDGMYSCDGVSGVEDKLPALTPVS